METEANLKVREKTRGFSRRDAEWRVTRKRGLLDPTFTWVLPPSIYLLLPSCYDFIGSRWGCVRKLNVDQSFSKRKLGSQFSFPSFENSNHFSQKNYIRIQIFYNYVCTIFYLILSMFRNIVDVSLNFSYWIKFIEMQSTQVLWIELKTYFHKVCTEQILVASLEHVSCSASCLTTFWT